MAVLLEESSGTVETLGSLEKARSQAHSPEAQTKRKQTQELRQRLQREDVVLLRQRGMVPLAIADKIGRSVEWVASVLNEQGFEIPAYLSTVGGKYKPERCGKCGKALR